MSEIKKFSTSLEGKRATVNHGLGSKEIIAAIYNEETGTQIGLDVSVIDENHVTIEANSDLTGYKLVVIG